MVSIWARGAWKSLRQDPSLVKAGIEALRSKICSVPMPAVRDKADGLSAVEGPLRPLRELAWSMLAALLET